MGMLQHFIGNSFISPQFGTTDGGLSSVYKVKDGSGYLHRLHVIINPAIAAAGTYYFMVIDKATAPVSGVTTAIDVRQFVHPGTTPEFAYGCGSVTFELIDPIPFSNGCYIALSTDPLVFTNAITSSTEWIIATGLFS